jgi:hypothetical protein
VHHADRFAERLHSAALHLLRRLREVDAEAEIGPSHQGVDDDQARSGFGRTRLISRSAAKDRRSVILRATSQGTELLLKARGRRLDLFTGMLQGASAADLATLAKASDVIDRLLSS